MSENNNNNNNQGNNNRQRTNQIRGPTSALTSFLREQGITVQHQNRRARRREEAAAAAATQGNSVAEGPSTPESSSSSNNNQVQLTEQATSSLVALRLGNRSRLASTTNKKKKRKASDSDDDGDSEDEDVFLPSTSKAKPNTRAFVVFCAICRRRFTRKINQPEVEECPSCLSGESSSTSKPPVKRKKVVARMNKTLGDNKKVPSLQSLCIGVIAINIDDVESFGFISEDSLTKLSKIISKNRKMTDETSRLFMEPTTRDLKLYDCTAMTDVALLNVAQFCPRLQSLYLSYCGHMNDKVIEGYGKMFSNLKSLHLSGAYLVTKEAWINLFKKLGTRLDSFELRYTSRFDLDCLQQLIQYCPNLTNLKFGHITAMNSTWLEGISKLKKLTSLELAWPNSKNNDAFKTKEVVQYLSKSGAPLQHLSLKGAEDQFTDELFSGLTHCKNLKRLYIELANHLSAEEMVKFLQNWENPGLEELDVSQCTLFDDNVLKEIIKHSGSSLKKLNLHSLHLLTSAGLESMTDTKSVLCSQLEEIDCSFVRSIDDYVLAKLIKHCKALTKINVYGCPLLTDMVKGKDSLTIAGRELLDIPV